MNQPFPTNQQPTYTNANIPDDRPMIIPIPMLSMLNPTTNTQIAAKYFYYIASTLTPPRHYTSWLNLGSLSKTMKPTY